jgi:hypothetical protein
LCVAARGAPGRRLKSIITVYVPDPPPDEHKLAPFTQIQFQQHAANEQMQVLRKDTFDDPATSSYDLYVDRDGVWWCVNFLVAEEMTVLSPNIRQYINTVVFP